MKINKIILKPLITEKSTREASNGKYTFAVTGDSSKSLIAKTIEDLYKVDVTAVRTLLVAGKKKKEMGKRTFFRESKWKKAIVSLKSGQKIGLFETKEAKE